MLRKPPGAVGGDSTVAPLGVGERVLTFDVSMRMSVVCH
jgi:hypothetical protein